MSMHYVSQFNYFKSVERLADSFGDKPDLSEAVAGLSRFSLRDVLNNEEIELMYKHKTTLAVIKQWADSGVKVDAHKIREHLHRREKYFVPMYVMKVNTPRYHANPECEYLKATFENFVTPPEIKHLGPEKVREFQVFCDKEWPHYKDRPIDIFWAHVGSHFGVSISPEEVSLTSQQRPMSVQGLREDELIGEIQRVAKELRNHASSTTLTKYIYAPTKRIRSFAKDPRLEKARRQAFAEILKFKKEIKMLVFNFHRVELEMPEGLLSDELLEALGFLPCRACCGRG